ncbi:MAG: vitamin B12 dependent methionine synthase [Desulfitobacteriaceae bacterium]
MMTRLEWNHLKLDISEIYRRIGMPNADSERSLRYQSLIEQMRLKALELIEACGIYDYVPVEVSGSGEILLANQFPVSASTSFFNGAQEVLLAVLTIGSRLEEESSRLFKEGEMLEGMILDGCGTVALDEALTLLRGEIVGQVSARGLQTGYNLSPGGRRIPLEAQKAVFALLDGERIGVALSDSMLMTPVKSHSLLIPVGLRLEKPNLSCVITCEMCATQHTCAFSSLKFSKAKAAEMANTS